MFCFGFCFGSAIWLHAFGVPSPDHFMADGSEAPLEKALAFCALIGLHIHSLPHRQNVWRTSDDAEQKCGGAARCLRMCTALDTRIDGACASHRSGTRGIV
mmetsp:Transcript_19022/g.36608  ORF Transcript_19022/g.36608 Transcript_19022/m.36608 type:complete len:101 (+) Transcript_19022:42-344(+)